MIIFRTTRQSFIKSKYWTGTAICKYGDCNKTYSFEILNKPSDNKKEDIEILVRIEGSMNHDESIPVKRYLGGRKRKEIAKRCRLEGTMNVRENLIINVTDNEVKARDLTNIINSYVLKKAVQENKEIERLDKDSFKELDIARDAFIVADIKSKTVKGYIHYLAQYPFTVIFFNEDQLLTYLKELRSNKQLNINFDATGSVVSKMSNKRTFYYTMVINIREFGIFQIADCLTDDNSQASIITFLNTF